MALLASRIHLVARRTLATSARLLREDMGGNTGINPYGSNIPAKFRLIKEKQKVFNVDNGKRVHERGGTDSMFHTLTLVVLIAGGVEWCRVWWKLAYPSGFK